MKIHLERPLLSPSTSVSLLGSSEGEAQTQKADIEPIIGRQPLSERKIKQV